MKRAITRFHVDEAGEWVAELSCGHDQHVRHRPPFTERPWVTTPEGRAARVGTPMECPLCDRGELPAGLRRVRTSPEWTERTLPAGLRRSHRLAPGTWGRLQVHEGRVRLAVSTDPPRSVEIAAGGEQVIPPDVGHEVEPIGAVRVSIDFLAVDRQLSTRSSVEPIEGGDPPCWADQICPTCGRMLDSAHDPAACAGPA